MKIRCFEENDIKPIYELLKNELGYEVDYSLFVLRVQEMIKNKDVHFSNSYDERERVIEYLSRLKKMNQQQLEEEKKNVINELFDLGDDLNGNNLSYRDLQLALITGRDLDGIDIPNDTPEERQAEEHTEKMIKEEKYTREVD